MASGLRSILSQEFPHGRVRQYDENDRAQGQGVIERLAEPAHTHCFREPL
jgi:hypothetical protein